MSSLPPRFDITAEQIDTMMAAFYSQIRAHEVLGPIFGKYITDWQAHEARIASFWRNAILHERGYDGRPQQVHMRRPEIMPEHFALWLDLFEETAHRVLPELPARAWTAFARRIGGGMRMGIEQVRAAPGAVPVLRMG